MKLLFIVEDDAEADSDVDDFVDGFPRAELTGRLVKRLRLFRAEEEKEEEDEEWSCCRTNSKSI